MTHFRAPVLDADGNSVGEVAIRESEGRHVVERTTFINQFSREITQMTAIGLRVALLSHCAAPGNP